MRQRNIFDILSMKALQKGGKMFDSPGETTIIVGRRKHQIRIDEEDLNLLKHYNVYVQCRTTFRGGETKKVLAYEKGQANEDRVMIPLKKLLMKAVDGQEVEHVDGNPLDLRKVKLKVTGIPKPKRKRKLIKRT